MAKLSPEYKKLAEIKEAEGQLSRLNFKLDELSADAALMAGGMLPPPFGTAADVVSLAKSVATGDWGGALWDLVGFIPIAGDAAKAAIKGTKAAEKLRAIKKAVDKASGVVRKKKEELAEILKKQRNIDKDKVTQAAKDCGKVPCGVKNTDQDMIDNLINKRRDTKASGDATFAQGRDGDGKLTDVKESRVQSDGSVIHAETQVLDDLAKAPKTVAVDQKPCINCTHDLKNADVDKVIVPSTPKPGNPTGSPKTAARKAAERGDKVEPRIIELD